MKGQRLIYTEVLPNVFESQDFILNHETVKVKLDKNENKFYILNETNQILAEGRSKNYTVLRSLARKALKALGVSLRDEIRKVLK